MELIVEAQPRENTGTAHARRLRRGQRVPAVVYGEGRARHISVDAAHFERQLQHEPFRASVLKMRVGDEGEFSVLLRDVQRHPFRRDVLHADFLEVSEKREINANVPLHFINAEVSPGVKLHHGILTVIENEVEIHCLPRHLPDHIEVDVGGLDIGKSVHLGEIPAPEGVRFVALTRGADPALAIVSEPAKIEEEAKPAEGEGAETATEEKKEGEDK